MTNKRIAADPSKSRTFSDEEINAMFQVVKDNKSHLLMLTIFREIGLRISSMLHLKISMILNEFGDIRNVCKVPEKNQTIREFVVSNNLKSKIKDYIESLNLADHATSADLYLFYPSGRLSRRTMSDILKRIASQAGLQTTKIHAHCFRHTLVSKLIEAGNTIELVSKFMGHSNVKTTETHYFVSTASQLEQCMNNPFTEKFFRKRHSDEEQKLDNEIVSAKKQKLMEMIFVYNTIIANNAKNNNSAKDIQNELFEKLPKLGEILQELDD